MAETHFGRVGGWMTIGEVMDVKTDPSQTGRVKVQWHVGAASQGDMSTDDLPYTSVLFPPTNPSQGGMGGPHTGLQVGTKVYGVPIDGSGQEFMIIGSVPRHGNGAVDTNPTYDSDLPHTAKVQENNGEQQPRHGDINYVVTKDKSIWQYGQQVGGQDQVATKYDTHLGSIGYVGSITESA